MVATERYDQIWPYAETCLETGQSMLGLLGGMLGGLVNMPDRVPLVEQ